MSLLDNAVGAIQIAIEDFDSDDERRTLGAIRNLHAGILLLCKVKLQRLSPADTDDALLWSSLRPKLDTDGSVKWVGDRKKTADQETIKNRFNSLGINIDSFRLDKISRIRNYVEHYYLEDISRENLIETFADGCVLIRQIVMDVLGENPEILFGENVWSALYQNKLVFEKELSDCRRTLEKLTWSKAAADVPGNILCPNCGSQLVRQLNASNTDPRQASFQCAACGQKSDFETLVLGVLEEVYAPDAHLAAKDGGDQPLEECLRCGEVSYIIERGSCALCGHGLPEGAECLVCGEPLTIHDYIEHESLCSYHAYVADRERDR